MASTGAAADTGSEEETAVEGVRATEPGVGCLGEGGGDGEPLPDSFVPGKIVHIYRQEMVRLVASCPTYHLFPGTIGRLGFRTCEGNFLSRREGASGNTRDPARRTNACFGGEATRVAMEKIQSRHT